MGYKEFKGDDRGAGEEGTSRLSVEVTFEKVPGQGMKSSAASEAGESHRRDAGDPATEIPDTARAKQTQASGRGLADHWHCGWASAAYPFIPSPDIDIRYTIWVWCGPVEEVWIPGLGRREIHRFSWQANVDFDSFPDLEVLVNGTLEGDWVSPDSGPGLNLMGNPDHSVT
ncbi:MAG: hypothetical protein ACK54P_11450, partial [Bacteroidota bacterium]